MIIKCGTNYDKRILNLTFPQKIYLKNINYRKLYHKKIGLLDNDTIGVFVSGGIDSALLYFLMIEENLLTGNNWKIIPYTILRKEGSRFYALKVINWIHSFYNLNHISLNIVGDNTLSEFMQVQSGIDELICKKVDYVYIGVIESRPEHSLNWNRHTIQETFNVRYPFLHLQKTHILDIYKQKNILELLQQTHSCAVNEILPCKNCNGCNERSWGFKELGL